MTSLPPNHLARIANFYSAKLDELKFYLERIVENCDESMRLFNVNRQNEDTTAKIVTFSFSAYTNTIQTLKETAGMLLKDALPWSEIKRLRHGEFMYGVRNAMTHDGNPVISGWADGRYFVPNKIVRLNKEKKIVVIHPPMVDVRQFCLEFSADFSTLLSKTLKQIPHDDRMAMAIFDINEIDEMVQDSLIIPEFAKHLLSEQREQILEAIRDTKAPRIEEAIKKAEELAAYCNAKLT